MKGSRRHIRAATLFAIAMLVVGCSGAEAPVDATRQIDDFPLTEKPRKRLTQITRTTFDERCTKERYAALMAEAKNRPKMMAIGGSVFNGVSSMQINWWLSEWSPPAQVARALAGARTNAKAIAPGTYQVPRYPDYGLDPYGLTANDEPHFRLGLDLETMKMTLFDLVEPAFRRQGAVMSWFETYSADGRAFNDNLSFAGASVDDLLYGTSRDYRARLDAVRRVDRFEPDADRFWGSGGYPRTYRRIMERARRTNGATEIAYTAGPLKTIFFAQNSSFVLNPTRDPCLEDMTPLDQVRLRKPERLLIGVGSNSGLFTFLSAGQPVDKVCGDVQFTYGDVVREEKRYVSIRQTAKEEFLASMRILLEKLSTDAKAIDHIYVMGQLRPRMVANIDPEPDQGIVGHGGLYPPGRVQSDSSTYHDQYYLAFAPGGSGRWLSGKELRLADALNDEVNKELLDLIKAQNAREGKERFIFVDLKPLEQYDVKHIADRDVIEKQPGDTADPSRKRRPGEAGAKGKPIVVTKEHMKELGDDTTIELDNRVLTFSRSEERITDSQGNSRAIGQHIKRGGIFSVDNLHPTVVGYALLAQRLLETIVKTEKIDFAPGTQVSISPQMAYVMQQEGGSDAVRHGNVLRRLDRGLATRGQLLQTLFDVGANIAGGLDCWRRPGDVR